MPTLPELANFDAGRFIGFGQAGQKQRTLADLGRAASAGDYKGAEAAAFAGGETEIGLHLKQMNDEDKMRLVGQAASWAQQADTPEKWAAGADLWKSKGYDPGPFQARQVLLSQAMTLQDRLQQQNADRDFGLRKSTADRMASTAGVPPGYVKAPDGRLTFAPGGPADPAQVAAISAARGSGAGKRLTATDKKAILEADDAALAANNVIIGLNRALELNDKAYSGFGASQRGYVGSLVGDQGGVATEELNNTVMTQVLDSLKATFGGMPTEGERQVLIDVQGSASKAPEVRRAIYEKALQAAQRRLEFNKQRADELRSGSFYDGAAEAGGELQPGAVQDGYRYNGGDPSDPSSWEPE